MTAQLETLSEARCCDGVQGVYAHRSAVLDCDMRFALFVPPGLDVERAPLLWWLSGLTCNEQNFITKAGAQRYAAQHRVAIVSPDTSPRGVDIPGQDDDWDFGSGAGFYLNATREPWSAHYRMYDYIIDELPEWVADNFPVNMERQAISGHSMGGHGALVLALRNPGRFRSVSAFAPVVAPSKVPWGEKAFSGYLGDDREQWCRYDACELLSTATERLPLRVDQGDADAFLNEQLRPELLREACAAAGHPLDLRMREGYDHSYYFIASFIGEHIAHHAKALWA